MSHYKDQILACDFFTLETFFLQTLYAFFFIELGSRRVHFAGCTEHPNAAWGNQQARQVVWDLEGHSPRLHFLIHDRDSKFTQTFDTIFSAEQLHVIHTPVRTPNANTFAERWVRTVRNECLDKLLVFNEAHLRRALREIYCLLQWRSSTPGVGAANTYTENQFHRRWTNAMPCDLGWTTTRLLPRRRLTKPGLRL